MLGRSSTPPLPALRRPPGGDADRDFRIDAPAEIARLLRALRDGGVPLSIGDGSGSGAIYGRLHTYHPARGLLGFAVDADDPRLPALLGGAAGVVAVGLLDRVKLQFDLNEPLLVRSADSVTLRCGAPGELWRFQRRAGFRVSPLLRSGPYAGLRHPALADMRLSLRVLDLSIGGCALLLPHDVPTIEPGLRINDVQLQLDADTRIDHLGLLLRHVSAIGTAEHRLRLGCEWQPLGGDAERTLQRYIDQVQRGAKTRTARPTCS